MYANDCQIFTNVSTHAHYSIAIDNIQQTTFSQWQRQSQKKRRREAEPNKTKMQYNNMSDIRGIIEIQAFYLLSGFYLCIE